MLHRQGKNLESATNNDQATAQTTRIGQADAISEDTKERVNEQQARLEHATETSCWTQPYKEPSATT
jgi:hypothetical protein